MSRRPRYAVPTIEQPSQNWTTILGNNLPLTFVLVAAFGFAVWYGTTNSERSQSTKEVETLKSGLSELSKTIVTINKEQDERRAALGKEFLNSNKEIGSEVNKLSTAIALQQAQTKATSDALTKISEQLQQLNGGSTRRR